MSRSAVLATGAVIAAGCGGSSWISKDDLAEHLSPSAVLLDVPLVPQQESEDCGVAVIEALLRYHGRELDAETARRWTADAAATGGIRAGDIVDSLRARGFQAVLVRGRLDGSRPAGLLGLLDHGLPVVAELAVTKPDATTRHYVLVIGYHPERRWVFVMDPMRGIGAIPYDAFDAHWRAADSLLLVAAPRGGEPSAPTPAARPRPASDDSGR